MPKSKEEILYEYITDHLKQQLNNGNTGKEKIQTWADMLEVQYGIPQLTSMNALTLKQSPDQLSRKMQYWILSVIQQTEKISDIKRFFTKKEIAEFGIASMLADAIHFPLEFNVIEVTDDQWIGKITAKELVRLRDAGLIYYNPEAQRPFIRVANGKTNYVKINSNPIAINAIDEGFLSGARIPDTITLNIPEVSESSYENGKLIITEMEHFELLDGYHRFVAINRNTNRDSNFDCPMEIRFTKFTLEKERQFINQEDQKVPMKKIDSAAFNQASIGNQIVAKLKEKSGMKELLQSSIVINEGMLGLFFDVFYDLSKDTPRKRIVEIRDLFYRQISDTFDTNLELLNKKLTYNSTLVYAYLWAMETPADIIVEQEDKLEKELFKTVKGMKETGYKKVIMELKERRN